MVHFIMTKVEVGEMGTYDFSLSFVTSLTQKCYWRQFHWQDSVISLGHVANSQVGLLAKFLVEIV